MYNSDKDRNFSDKTFIKLKIIISDYADDFDYSVKIEGKTGEVGKTTDKRWKESDKIFKESDELTFSEAKNFIKNELDKHF